MTQHASAARTFNRLYLYSAQVERLILLACFGLVVVVSGAPDRAHAQTATVYSQQKIETLVAPVALYPDALLAQVFTAAAYPGDIVRAARWLAANPQAAEQQDFAGGDAQKWDPSVKALLRFPAVLEKMNTDLDWTTELGEAFVNQPRDVAAAVQSLREQAANAGVLQSNAQQKIRRVYELDREIIFIEPVQPDLVYVPYYDPFLVYGPTVGFGQAALITFGAAVIIRSIIQPRDPWNWRTGAVYRPYWPGYGAVRPNAVAVQPWRPNPTRYRSNSVPRPAAVRPTQAPARLPSQPAQRQPFVGGGQVRAPAVTRSPSAAVQRSAPTRPSAARPYVNRPSVSRPAVRPNSYAPPRAPARAPAQAAPSRTKQKQSPYNQR